MSTFIQAREGTIPFRGYRTWYRVVGDHEDPGKLPVLILHGGPGIPHDYLEPLEALAQMGRRVIVYDQLGCGNSDHPHDPAMWTVQLFLDEVTAVRRALNLDQVHLLGQSWGGMLAMEYALTHPAGLASIIVADAYVDTAPWVAEVNRLRAELPEDVRRTLQAHEAAGSADSPEYQSAAMAFYRRHICRMDPWPECLARTFEKVAQDPEVYFTMIGPSEFHVIGRLKDWSIVDRLSEINIPTLVLSGRYDEVTPAVVETVHRGIPNSQWVLFEQSAHMPHLEESGRYLQVVNEFFTRVEGAR